MNKMIDSNINNDNIKNKKEILIFVFQIISDCLSRNGCNRLCKTRFIKDESLFFELQKEFNITKQDFYKILCILKKRFPIQYRYLQINSKKWTPVTKEKKKINI